MTTLLFKRGYLLHKKSEKPKDPAPAEGKEIFWLFGFPSMIMR
jgi:hypothetical protein